jgi:hypothetical protein
MQRLVYLVPVVALACLSVPTASDAQRYDPYRWCAQYGGFGGDGGRNCGFLTIEQCQAAISGVGGYCTPNQFYSGPVYGGPYPSERRAQKHRHNRPEKYD